MLLQLGRRCQLFCPHQLNPFFGFLVEAVVFAVAHLPYIRTWLRCSWAACVIAGLVDSQGAKGLSQGAKVCTPCSSCMPVPLVCRMHTVSSKWKTGARRVLWKSTGHKLVCKGYRDGFTIFDWLFCVLCIYGGPVMHCDMHFLYFVCLCFKLVDSMVFEWFDSQICRETY